MTYKEADKSLSKALNELVVYANKYANSGGEEPQEEDLIAQADLVTRLVHLEDKVADKTWH